jgi:cytochrome c5
MKPSPRILFVSACFSVLGGCAGSQPSDNYKPDFVQGGRVFERYCAQCHLDPDNDSDAPQLDDAEDWDMRTHLWTAVLKDHANNGFLRMPAKGGHSALTKQNINDALYYMQIKIKALE